MAQKLETTGERIHRLRRRRRLSQYTLAEAAGISDAALSRYERDERDIPSSVLLRIAAALSTTPNDLLAYSEDRENPGTVNRQNRRAA